MTGSFGDADSVRGLGRALLRAAGALGSMTGDLSHHVNGLVPDGWSGDSAQTFRSDWSGKARQADQLAAVCNHVGRVLTELANQIDGANQQAARAQQMTGGVASRLAGPASGQKSAQALSQATAAAEQARAAARAKLSGIQVPRFGRAMTAREVSAWASGLGQQPSMPALDHFLHDAGTFAKGQLNGVRDTAEGIWDGYKQLASGFWDMGDVRSPEFAPTWEGLGRLFEVWDPPTMESAWGNLEKGLVNWDEWRTDPGRALGNTLFNAAGLYYGPKVLKAGRDATDAGEAAAGGEKTAQAARQAARQDWRQIDTEDWRSEPHEDLWRAGGRLGPASLPLRSGTGEPLVSPEERLAGPDGETALSRTERLQGTQYKEAYNLNSAIKANGTEIYDLFQPRPPAAALRDATVARAAPHTAALSQAASFPDAISAAVVTYLVLSRTVGISEAAVRNILVSALVTDFAAQHSHDMKGRP